MRRAGTGPGRHHNSLLYRVWGEKTNLLALAAADNPFSSSYFLWLDIGAVRSPEHNHQTLVKRRPRDKVVVIIYVHCTLYNYVVVVQGVLLYSVQSFTPAELELEAGRSTADFSLVDRLGGGTIGES